MTTKFYQVGGAVRDSLLDLKSKDVDYAVETDSFDSMRQAILDKGGEIFLESPLYFTIRARVAGMGCCDYVLCRRDGAYSDGRHPESVTPGSIFDDLARRDFTVNAMARDEEGTLIDPHNGQEDLRKKLLRCVGNTEARFTEDGLRMLRALRFAITKDFAFDYAISKCLQTPEFFISRLQGVSQERVREELTRCFQHDVNETLEWLEIFAELRFYLFDCKRLWLRPTLELRS